jgi:hypothetical protein
MMPVRLRPLAFVVLALAAAAPVAGCQRAWEGTATSSTEGIDGLEFDRFPSREAVDSALANFQVNQAGARAHDPVPLNEFFGERVQGAFSGGYKVEIIKPDERVSDEPIAVLHIVFTPTPDPLNINNRFKDLNVFKLADSLGAPFNPFPEAAAVPGETGIIMRLWTDFRKMSKGVPPDMAADQVLPELARISIWSYVVGNTDGVNNAGNAGFAKFRDASGREFWHAVLVDAGGAFNSPAANFAPWTLNLAGRGPVQAANIPPDVVNELVQLARASDSDLDTWAGVDPASQQRLAQAMPGVRTRAQQVLSQYGMAWQ